MSPRVAFPDIRGFNFQNGMDQALVLDLRLFDAWKKLQKITSPASKKCSRHLRYVNFRVVFPTGINSLNISGKSMSHDCILEKGTPTTWVFCLRS